MIDPLAVFGASPRDERLARILRSPNYRDGKFRNPVESTTLLPGSFLNSMRRQFLGREQRAPNGQIPVVLLTRATYDAPPPSGLRVTWMGHSSVLIETDGYRVLVDPVWGERAAHLERWHVPRTSITELDWDDAARIGSLAITAQPARHFSVRSLVRDRTLWASWVIAGTTHRVVLSGDTGYVDALADIGVRHGPFDLTMIKIGSYGETWPDIHLNPEQALHVHTMLGGRVLLPLHWGTFNLAFHAWHEPPGRLLAAAEREVRIVIPAPGQLVEPAVRPTVEPWWRRVESARAS